MNFLKHHTYQDQGFVKQIWYLKAFTVIFALAHFSTAAYAQATGQGRITGKVIDSVTSRPVDFATISLFRTGTKAPFTGISTDPKGDFDLTGIPDGDYQLEADFLGYQAKTINHIQIGSKKYSISLGGILLAPAKHQLKEVMILSKAPVLENKVDKLVYNAAADLTSQAGTATDVLAKVPMMSVDIDGNVELQGNANVRFLINGKPANSYGSSITDALQTIPAGQILRIEVMTSPGAKYDAAGTAGIINIVLKDNKTRGVNGSINLSTGTRFENGTFNLNSRTNNWGLGIFLSGNDQINSSNTNTADRLSFNAKKDTMTRYIQKRFSPFSRKGYQSGLNFDWNLTPRDAFTATLGYNQILTRATGKTAQEQQTFLSNGITLDEINSERITATHFGENAINWSMAYKKTFKKEGRGIDVLYSSSLAKNNNYDAQVTYYLNGGYRPGGIHSNNPGNDHQTDISIDYTEPVAKDFQLETGLKAVLENIDNAVITDTLLNNGIFVNFPGQTYGFSFRRNIYAAYITASFSIFQDFINGKAGVRLEHTDTKSDLSGVHIPADNIWAPNILMLHKLNENQSLKFAYTYRIERPDYGDLNPFLSVIDPHNLTTGNPLLKNETGHKFELGYSNSFTNNTTLYFGAFYNYNDNDIQSFTTYYPIYGVNAVSYYNVSISKTTNIGSQKTAGINLSGSTLIANHLSLRSDVFLMSKNNSVPGLPDVGGFSYKTTFNIGYEFNSGFAAEAFGVFNSKRTDFQSVRPGSYVYTFAVKKQLLHKKASIAFTSTNPFKQYINQYSSAYGTGFTQINLRQKTMRSFGFTLSYKFGNLKPAKNDSEVKTSAIVD